MHWEIKKIDETALLQYCIFCNGLRSNLKYVRGFPGGSDGKESAYNAGELDLIPGSGKIPWRREWLCTPVFWPGEIHGLYGPCGHKELDTAEQLSLTCT